MQNTETKGLIAAAVHTALAASAVGLVGVASADGDYYGYHGKDVHITAYPPQMAGNHEIGWGTEAIFTVGENVDGYTPPGIPDGMYAWKRGDEVRVLINHELTSSAGYAYTLRNGAKLTGARVSAFDIDRDTRRVTDARPAYHTIYNRAGKMVYSAADLEFGGLNRLCSASGIDAGDLGFVDDIFFTGEETGGGTEWALDVDKGALWAAPAMGRAAWESVTPIAAPSYKHVALIVGDDRNGAPLTLYVGEKRGWRWDRHGSDFLDRNGLGKGKLYVWVSDTSDADPSDFNGTGSVRTGKFVEIDYYRPDLAGNGDYDELGYATQDKQDALAAAAGAFGFSRPEDVGTNPNNSLQIAFNSTGSSFGGGADLWGTVYQVDVTYTWNGHKLEPLASITILYDGDETDKQANGLRSPDNLTWSANGMIYVQEDRSIGGFGDAGEEASIWELDPTNRWVQRIAQMDRAVVAPIGAVDTSPADIGNWESSGIIDVTALFPTKPGEVLLLGNTQAHSVRQGPIEAKGLVEGGQLFFLNFWGGLEP